ncbi:MAG: metalloregulator ArsR/SmtB family transcription factor [Micromonosporaceae bacterium]|nr:metalloregulator ArsR/SmtB family transcription factor [Micromonosporaceae bacterium]
MHAFDVLGDPVRRRILELLADGEQTAGAVTDAIRAEFGISQPAVSQHLKVLRESGFATVRAEGTRRLYAVNPGALSEVDQWLDRFRAFWSQRMDALETELFRGRREARQREATAGTPAQAQEHRLVARQRRAESQSQNRRDQAQSRGEQRETA